MIFTEKEVELANCYNLYYCRFVITREWYFLTCHNKTASTDRYKTFCHVYKMFWKTVRWKRLTSPPPLPQLIGCFSAFDRFRFHITDDSYGIIRDLPITIALPHHTESYEICRLLFRFHIIQMKVTESHEVCRLLYSVENGGRGKSYMLHHQFTYNSGKSWKTIKTPWSAVG